jgi:hypothetical protein
MDVIPFRDQFNFFVSTPVSDSKNSFQNGVAALLESSHEFIWVDLKNDILFYGS